MSGGKNRKIATEFNFGVSISKIQLIKITFAATRKFSGHPVCEYYRVRYCARVSLSRGDVLLKRRRSAVSKRCDLLNILWSIVVPEGKK